VNFYDKYTYIIGRIQMAGNVYKTSQGKELDLGKLMLKNEEVRAVGNMNTNARGDVIDSNNKKVVDRNKQVSKNYRKQIGTQVKDMPVVNSKKAAQIIAEKYVNSTTEVTEVTGLDDDVTIVDVTPVVENITAEVDTPVVEDVTEVVAEAKGGLAEAIAKAREVKQETVKTPQEEARSVDGVKKI